MAGAKGRSGRKASPATAAIREIVNDPTAVKNALKFAKTNPEFWFKLYQQIHGRPAQALSVDLKQENRDEFVAVFGTGEEASPAAFVPVPKGPAN